MDRGTDLDTGQSRRHLLWWAILFPAISVPIIACTAVGIASGGKAAVISGVVISAAYMAWACLDATSFEAWVIGPVRRRWLTWWRYTRSWESVCTLHGLTAHLGERRLVPALRSLVIGAHTDVLDLRVVTGQSVADWHKCADALAAAWRADRLTIRATAPGNCGSPSCARSLTRGARGGGDWEVHSPSSSLS